jgi:hypothetical protein
MTRRNIFHTAAAAVWGTVIAGTPKTSTAGVIKRSAPIVTQADLRRVLDLMREGRELALDIRRRLDTGADFERGALGVSTLCAISLEEFEKEVAEDRSDDNIQFNGIEIAPAEDLDYQVPLLEKCPGAYVLR